MHAVIRRYLASRDVLEEARPQLDHLARTMRQTPGFLAYYFLETPDGLTTITVTEDESGTRESMERAADWVRQNLQQSRASLQAPEVTAGEVLMHVTPEGGDMQRIQSLASRYAMRVPTSAVRGDGTTECPPDYPVKGNADSGIYHEPGSSSYAQTIPEFCFSSASAAEAAGFTAAGS
jgi:large subunit ribosomal protein L17